MNKQKKVDLIKVTRAELKALKRREEIEAMLDMALVRAQKNVPEEVSEPDMERERLEEMVKAVFSGDFIDMVAMKACHALEERLKEDKDGLKLLTSMYCLLLYQRYVESNAEGLVKGISNQMAMEDVGEISHLTEWEVE